MDFTKLMSMASGHVEARIVQAALNLGVFDALAGTPSTAHQIADRLKLDRRATELLLNALAALQLLHKRAEQYDLVEAASRYLVAGSSEYLGGMIRFEAMLWQAWEHLPESIRSGKPARPPQMYQNDPAETAIFIDAMASLVQARGDVAATAQAFPWQDKRNLLDVGAGPATYPIGLCQRFSQLSATIFDLPGTLAITQRNVADCAMTERVRCIAGDYRTDAIPGTYDVIFVSNIIHGESLEENRKLMVKLYAALGAGGHLVIKDHILNDARTQPPVGAIFSLLMLLTTAGGRCFSFHEITQWLTPLGFKNIGQIDLPPPFTSSFVVAEK